MSRRKPKRSRKRAKKRKQRKKARSGGSTPDRKAQDTAASQVAAEEAESVKTPAPEEPPAEEPPAGEPPAEEPAPEETAPEETDPVPHRPPPRGFWLGALFGLVLVTPLYALLAFGLGHLQYLAMHSLEALLGYSAAFVALPAAITAGGIGRLVVRRVLAGAPLRRAVRTAAANLSVAGVGLVILVALPASPTADTSSWWVIAIAGALTGALAGAVLGMVAGATAKAWKREEHVVAVSEKSGTIEISGRPR